MSCPGQLKIFIKRSDFQIQAFAEAGYLPSGISDIIVWYVMLHHGINDQRYFSVVTAREFIVIADIWNQL